MRALDTGATGFIGRRLAASLCARGHDVVCLVRGTSDTSPLEGLSVKLAAGELRDPASLDAAVRACDRVFHLAGVVQAVDDADFEAVNVRGTAALVEACLRSAPGLERFVLVSSIAAAGPSGPEGPRTEADEPRPVSPYGRSKLAAERVVLGASDRLPATIVRPPNVLGPGSRELERAIGLLRKRIVPSIGDDLPRTSLVDVDDLVEALVLSSGDVRSVGEIYYVTDGRAYAWPEITAALAEELGVGRFRFQVPFGAQRLAAGLAEAAARLTGRPPALTRDIVRAGRDHFWLYDGSKIRRELGFRPSVTMRDSVRRAVERAAAGEGKNAAPAGKGR
ncbi:MAG: NAD-dependent epimerase/dehydratase family protein [Candidatus Aminicenantes bacterium]|nr:NAD-dependent epimerase/dehydratase family protein [Candidatus Aminicenantes bacterium]